MIGHLNSLPFSGLLIVISVGYILGNVTIRGVSMGPAGATLFVSLMLGRAGLVQPDTNSSFSIGMFGFMLFVYSVGFEAGPRFFASFRDRSGWKYAAVAAIVNLVAVGATFAGAIVLSLSATQAAGAMAGAMTSATIFAASVELAGRSTDISAAFALTYPVGLVGVVLILQLLPKFLGSDLAKEVIDEDHDDTGARRHVRYERGSPEVYRVLRVVHAEVVGQTLSELKISQRTGCVLTWIRRDDETFIARADTVLMPDDHVAAIGRVDELRELEQMLGGEVFDESLQRQLGAPRRVQIQNTKVIGHTLAELRLTKRYDCVITRIERGKLWIEPRADVVVLRGDVLTIVGRRDQVRNLARFLGRFRPRYQDTDIAVYTGGMFLGVLISDIELTFGTLTLGPGIAGGLIFAGLVLGWTSELGLLRASVPHQARQLVRDLGVMLFIGEVGLTSSQNLTAGFVGAALPILIVAVVAILASVLIALLIALRIFKLNAVDAFGSVSGGLTSSAALHTVRRISDSNAAAVAYVTAYATSSILATIVGRLIMAGL